MEQTASSYEGFTFIHEEIGRGYLLPPGVCVQPRGTNRPQDLWMIAPLARAYFTLARDALQFPDGYSFPFENVERVLATFARDAPFTEDGTRRSFLILRIEEEVNRGKRSAGVCMGRNDIFIGKEDLLLVAPSAADGSIGICGVLPQGLDARIDLFLEALNAKSVERGYTYLDPVSLEKQGVVYARVQYKYPRSTGEVEERRGLIFALEGGEKLLFALSTPVQREREEKSDFRSWLRAFFSGPPSRPEQTGPRVHFPGSREMDALLSVLEPSAWGVQGVLEELSALHEDALRFPSKPIRLVENVRGTCLNPVLEE